MTLLKNRVLIVDDTPANLVVLGEALTDDYEVIVATSGKIAIDKAVSLHPDLILLDIMMPGMNGYEVLKSLKENTSTQKIPVIFITAKNSEEDEVKGFALGAVDYITKPFSLSIVRARVKTQLELKAKTEQVEQLYIRLNEEIDKARLIHERTIMYEIPELEEIALSFYYHPAQILGGDYYNIIVEDSKLICYISDVSGHGMEGVIISAFIKESIESYIVLKKENIAPKKILKHLHRQYMRDNYPEDYFVCIFLMIIDLNTMEALYASAGFQDQPLVFTGEEEKTCLTTQGLPISNVIPEELMDFQEERFILTPGTTLFISTDGLTEQVSEKGVQYSQRLKEIFYRNCHLPPDSIKQMVNDDFYAFNNGSIQGVDDITFGIIQRKRCQGVEPYENI